MSYPIYFTYQNFYEQIYTSTKNEKNRAVLFKLLLLYGVEKIILKSSLIFESGVITSSTLKQCQLVKEKLLAELRPEALSLVDSFAFEDNTLHSAIGCENGKAYERLLDWAKNHNRVNKPEVMKEIVEEWKTAKSKFIPKAKLWMIHKINFKLSKVKRIFLLIHEKQNFMEKLITIYILFDSYKSYTDKLWIYFFICMYDQRRKLNYMGDESFSSEKDES